MAVGNELLILGCVPGLVAVWCLAYRHGNLRGLVGQSGDFGGRATDCGLESAGPDLRGQPQHSARFNGDTAACGCGVVRRDHLKKWRLLATICGIHCYKSGHIQTTDLCVVIITKTERQSEVASLAARDCAVSVQWTLPKV